MTKHQAPITRSQEPTTNHQPPNVQVRHKTSFSLPSMPPAPACVCGKGGGERGSALGEREFSIFATDWFGSTLHRDNSDLIERNRGFAKLMKLVEKVRRTILAPWVIEHPVPDNLRYTFLRRGLAQPLEYRAGQYACWTLGWGQTSFELECASEVWLN